MHIFRVYVHPKTNIDGRWASVHGQPGKGRVEAKRDAEEGTTAQGESLHEYVRQSPSLAAAQGDKRSQELLRRVPTGASRRSCASRNAADPIPSGQLAAAAVIAASYVVGILPSLPLRLTVGTNWLASQRTCYGWPSVLSTDRRGSFEEGIRCWGFF